MDKAKVYRRVGRVLLSVWAIAWVILICKWAIPYKGFNHLMLVTFTATVLNLAYNPCAFIGAILSDLVVLKQAPSRKPGWRRLIMLYFILWLTLFTFILRGLLTVNRPLNYGGGLQLIEKSIAGERK